MKFFPGQYFAASIVLVSVSCLFTVVVLNVHHRGALGFDVPRCVELVFIDCIGRLLLVHPHVSSDASKKRKVQLLRVSEQKRHKKDH